MISEFIKNITTSKPKVLSVKIDKVIPNNASKYYKAPRNYYNELTSDILASPHTLIGGTTGSGKSVLLNAIIYDFMHNYDVENKLFLIDPKRVELSIYKGLPHCCRYEHSVPGAISMLDAIIDTVNIRFETMERKHLRQYDGAHVYLIIDELADLMISEKTKEIRLKLQKILQIARACNVHVIACTQAPNRQIIPSNLVLNFTNRVALRCLSSIESRQICNIGGAETLPAYGKGLYLSPKSGIKQVDIPFIEECHIYNSIDDWTIGKQLVR